MPEYIGMDGPYALVRGDNGSVLKTTPAAAQAYGYDPNAPIDAIPPPIPVSMPVGVTPTQARAGEHQDYQRTPAENRALQKGLVTRQELDRRPVAAPEAPKVMPWQMKPGPEADAAWAKYQAERAAAQAPPTEATPTTVQLPAPSTSGGPAGAALQAAMGQAPGDGISLRATAPAGVGARAAGQGGGLGAVGELRKGRDAELRAVKEGEAAGVARASEEAAFRAQSVAEEEARQAAQAERDTQRKAQTDAALADVRKSIDDLAKPSGEIDPNRLWANTSTGNRILAAVGVFFSGLGGGQNQALAHIQNAIDTDIAAQRDNLARADANKRAVVEGKQSLFGMMRQKFNDDILAESAARAAAWQLAGQKMDYIGSKYAGAEKMAALAQQRAQIQQNYAKELGVFEERYAQRALEREKLGLQAASIQLDALGKAGKAAGAQVPATEAAQIGGLDAARGALKDLMASFKDNTGALSGLTSHLPGTSASKYADKLDVTAQVVGSLLEGGKLTEDDLKRYREMLPQPGDGKDRAAAKVGNILTLLEKQKRGKVDGLAKAGFNTGGFQQGPELDIGKRVPTT